MLRQAQHDIPGRFVILRNKVAKNLGLCKALHSKKGINSNSSHIIFCGLFEAKMGFSWDFPSMKEV